MYLGINIKSRSERGTITELEHQLVALEIREQARQIQSTSIVAQLRAMQIDMNARMGVLEKRVEERLEKVEARVVKMQALMVKFSGGA